MNKARISAIEAEFGEPILDLVRGFAADGESRSTTAELLNVPRSTFCRWLMTQPPIDWPPTNAGNAWLVANRTKDTTRMIEAARRNLAKARAAVRRKAIIHTPGLLDRITAARKQGVIWRDMADHLGIRYNRHSLARAYRKNLTAK